MSKPVPRAAGQDDVTPLTVATPPRLRRRGEYRLPDPYDRIPEDLLEQAVAEIEAERVRRS